MPFKKAYRVFYGDVGTENAARHTDDCHTMVIMHGNVAWCYTILQDIVVHFQ